MEEEKEIKIIENPLQTNGIDKLELEMGNDEAQELTRCRKCRILCGCESIWVTMLVFGGGGMHFYIFNIYNSSRTNGNWIFLALGILCCLLGLSFIARTCIAIQSKKEKKIEDGKTDKKMTKVVIMFDIIKTRYNYLFDVNGKYYLTKMYTAEMFEHTQQVYSLTEFYLCLMPVEISSIVCAVFIIELLVNIWATFHISSQEIRDRLILLDIFTDAFCVVFPLSYNWFIHGVPVGIEGIAIMTTYPTLSLYSKLNDIWEDYFKIDLERIQEIKTKQNFTRSRRRQSILKLSHNRSTFEKQLEHFPKWLRYGFVLLNIGFLLFFVSLISVHLTTQPPRECSDVFTKEVWEGCRVRVPFCQELVIAKCDCAIMEMINYTQKALPASFGDLKSLVTLHVYTGQLEQLPLTIGNDHKLRMLAIIGNRLESLPDNIGNLHTLMYFDIFNNRIRSLPISTGNLKNLRRLNVARNKLTSLPDSVGKLKNLYALFVSNNRLISLPDSVGKLLNLIHFEASKNRLTFLPDSVGNLKNLIWLYAWNNTLTSLPKTVGNMKSLIDVDVRHNGLTDLPSSVSQWNNIEYLYLAGNPLCANLNIPSNLKGAKGLCEQQCSADCPSVWLGDGFCGDNDYTYHYNPNVKPKPNSGCNTAACEYDRGDCPQ
jgi:Leucine-rich repeat (LRR) protein